MHTYLHRHTYACIHTYIHRLSVHLHKLLVHTHKHTHTHTSAYRWDCRGLTNRGRVACLSETYLHLHRHTYTGIHAHTYIG